mmetsp:Transcript_55591/g.161063  ORF Transcript_55591/g.161063 Transcript_55591/m.161063 type:complete len:380 (-) Transcript_55591:155-1294(-)
MAPRWSSVLVAAAVAGPLLASLSAADSDDKLAPQGSGEEPVETLPEDETADDACAASGDAAPCSLSLLQRRGVARLAAEDAGAEELATELVSEVYTYGAPATHTTPLRNKARADGCFGGLRCYTEDVVLKDVKDIDAAAIFNRYPHMRTATVVLRWQKESLFAPCDTKLDGHPEWPLKGRGIIPDWGLHQENDYTDRLDTVVINGSKATGEEPFRSAAKFAHVAWRMYEDLPTGRAKARKTMEGWRLVGYFVDKHGSDTDPVALVQEESSLDCVVLFTGTNSFEELFTSTTDFGTGYCGISHVHVGYRNELWTLTGKSWAKHIKPRLPQCSRVLCVGHSLGGALCELFSACANSGHTSDPDFQRLAWVPGTPTLMDRLP